MLTVGVVATAVTPIFSILHVVYFQFGILYFSLLTLIPAI